MDDNPKTLPDENEQDPDFTADQWEIDLENYFGGAAPAEPRRSDEFSLTDFMAKYGLSRWRAREFAQRALRQGVWSVRRYNNINLYRVVKDGRGN